MAVWDDILTGEDRILHETLQGALRKKKELGRRPAVLVIDVIYAWAGLKSEPVLESIKTFRTSCGEVAWESIPRIQQLLEGSREAGIPIIYSTMPDSRVQGARWANRARRAGTLDLVSDEELEKRKLGNTIVKEIEPQERDIVLYKRAASVFTGTPLLSHLNEMDIDTLLVTGSTTSGCVHATVVDAACANFYVGIVEECTFDRLSISHKSALLNMDLKYGTVIDMEEALGYVSTRAEPTFQVG